ncbi:MAG: hypothetical protein WB869_09035 [Candidatus Acidiferrales bacterium]|jgi:hypothetical protein
MNTPGFMPEAPKHVPTPEEIDDESRKMRRLRIVVNLALEAIAAGDMTAEEAARMSAATRRIALEMFPGKEVAYDLLYRPKFQRVMHAVYRLQ